MRRLIGRAFLATAGRRMRRIRAWQQDPISTQQRLLRDLIKKAEETRFGREHGFNAIQSVADYQHSVPLRHYLDFKPYWDKLFEGEDDVTWPGHIRFFALTSGTTAGNKAIPLSQEGVRSQMIAGRDIINFYLTQTRDTRFFAGDFLFLGGSTDLVPHPHDTLAGDLSGILTKCMPRYAQRFRLPRADVAFMTDWEQKLEAMAHEAWAADMRGMSGTPSWLMCLFERVLQLQKEAGQPAATLADVWPNFSLLVHGGVNYEPYRASILELCGKPIHTLEVYPASEGFIGIQDRLGTRDLLLMMDTGIFYEFVPVAELDDTAPRRFTVADVETGVDYAIVLTTNSGLWSYVIGDTVRFTSLRPHRIRITGRTAHFLNAFGEHLIVEEADTAMTEACRATGAEIQDYHLAPLYPTPEEARPTHQWLVEFVKEPPDRAMFVVLLDEHLRKQNDDYAAHRRGDVGMRSPELAGLPAGTFYAAMKQLGKLGGQHKAPRLKNNREFADVLLAAERP